MFTCVQMDVYGGRSYTCTWKPQLLFLRCEPLYFWPVNHMDLPVSSSPQYYHCKHTPSPRFVFYVGSKSSSGPHTCKASTLLDDFFLPIP